MKRPSSDGPYTRREKLSDLRLFGLLVVIALIAALVVLRVW